jgi:nitrogen fixation-related uncharacterized protein
MTDTLFLVLAAAAIVAQAVILWLLGWRCR